MKRAALLFLCLLALGQEPLSVTTRMVQVSVIVEDKQGRPVAGLAREDFVLTDGKRAEEIRSFSEHSDGLVRPATGLQPVPAGTYTNRAEALPDVPVAVTAIVIDQLNTEWKKQHYNRDMILKMLRKLDPNHRVALYIFGTQLRVLHDFTSNTSSLLEAIARMESRLPLIAGKPVQKAETGPAVAARDPLAQPEAGTNTESQSPAEASSKRWAEFEKILAETEVTNAVMDAQRNAWLTLNAIEAISRHLGRIPGRKNLIWVSSGFPTTFFEFLNGGIGQAQRKPHMLREFERTARALANADVAVYPVHGGDSGGIAVDVTQQSATSSAAARQWELSAWNTMLEVANRSGGRAFGTIHQFPDALDRAVADARVVYTLGYYPSHGKWDGAYREIKVKVNRPDVRVRHRPGYYALEQRTETPEERRAALDDAVWSPLDAHGISVDVRLLPPAKPGTAQLIVMVDPAGITVNHKDNLHQLSLDALYVLQSADGKNLKSFGQTFALNLPEDKYQQMLRQKIGSKRELELPPGADRVRVVIRDTNSSAIGSVTVPLAAQPTN